MKKKLSVASKQALSPWLNRRGFICAGGQGVRGLALIADFDRLEEISAEPLIIPYVNHKAQSLILAGFFLSLDVVLLFGFLKTLRKGPGPESLTDLAGLWSLLWPLLTILLIIYLTLLYIEAAGHRGSLTIDASFGFRRVDYVFGRRYQRDCPFDSIREFDYVRARGRGAFTGPILARMADGKSIALLSLVNLEKGGPRGEKADRLRERLWKLMNQCSAEKSKSLIEKFQELSEE